jgi:chorismate dehydratase
VVLVSKYDDLRKVRSVALDSSSRTSQALVKIIFLEFLNIEPSWQSSRPDLKLMMQSNDAALLIGDPGMTIPPPGLHVFDLASLWQRWTDTGFVFAMWMARETAVAAMRGVDFAGARDEGLEQIERIVAEYENEVPLSREEMTEYLTTNITFQIDESLNKGMRLYFELAAKHRLIENNKPLTVITS